ncbi:hypothetical protein [Pararhodobacter sp. CCB-MM2]|uniref:hypothetical protein n=1 Tax=Pararhodobacter sp. CCB-MM2 TaxID=1786003 RepID=UPI00083041F4|nr:hypothetical protein [Pararhodobacter sp. CCB-MM2]
MGHVLSEIRGSDATGVASIARRGGRFGPRTERRRVAAGLAPALAVAGLMASGTAAFAGTELLGGGFLIAKYNTCDQYGWTGTHQLLARMAPQGAPGNPDDETQLSLMFNTGTIAMRYDNVEAYRRTQTLDQATYIWNGPWTVDEPTMNFYYDLYGDIPHGTEVALDDLVLHFNNFNELEGCQVAVYLSLRQP